MLFKLKSELILKNVGVRRIMYTTFVYISGTYVRFELKLE